MTMVAACTFRDGAVIVSDSRASWQESGKNMASDNLQKIVSIGPAISFSYAGSVCLAGKIIEHIRKQARKNEKYRYVRKIASEIHVGADGKPNNPDWSLPGSIPSGG